jgi:hypothetical protein
MRPRRHLSPISLAAVAARVSDRRLLRLIRSYASGQTFERACSHQAANDLCADRAAATLPRFIHPGAQSRMATFDKVRRATSKTCAANGSGQWVLHQRRQWGVL